MNDVIRLQELEFDTASDTTEGLEVYSPREWSTLSVGC